MFLLLNEPAWMLKPIIFICRYEMMMMEHSSNLIQETGSMRTVEGDEI